MLSIFGIEMKFLQGLDLRIYTYSRICVDLVNAVGIMFPTKLGKLGYTIITFCVLGI